MHIEDVFVCTARVAYVVSIMTSVCSHCFVLMKIHVPVSTILSDRGTQVLIVLATLTSRQHVRADIPVWGSHFVEVKDIESLEA